MSIVVYSDVIVPSSVILAGGCSGRSTRQNDRTRNQGGYATANVVRDVTLREYSLGVKPMRTSSWAQIIGLYEITDAGAFGMLIEDPADASCSAITEGKVTLVDGFHQLFKRYMTAGTGRFLDRKITRPKPTVALYRNGVVMVGGYSLNADTGIVTITVPGADVFTWSGGFYVPVHFSDDAMDWDLVLPGVFDNRLIAGPTVSLMEIRE